MKIFRWQGIIVLLVLIALISIFFIFFFDTFLKKTLEKTLSSTLKRPVEIEKVETDLLSLKFNINVQIADNKDRYKNLLEIRSINFNLSSQKLAFKKYDVENLTVEEIRLNTKREKPWSIKERKKEEKPSKEEKQIDLKSFTEKLSLPSAKEILKREKLKTVETGKYYEEKLRELKTKWEDKYKELQKEKQSLKELQKQIKELEKRAKKIKSIEDLKTITENAKQIKKQINQKIERIKQLKKELKQDTELIKTAYSDLQKAYKEDINRLKRKYTLSLEGGVNLAGLIFGDKIKGYLEKVLSVYRTISPYLKKGEEKQKETEEKGYRLEGRYVKYKETNPYPDIVIQKGKLSLVAFNSNIEGNILNFSDNQKIYGKPFKITFKSNNSKYFESFLFDGIFDRTKQISKDSFTFEVKDLISQDLEIKNFVKFTDNKINLNGNMKILNEQNIQGVIKLIFEKTKPVVITDENAKRLVEKLFEGINRFYLAVNISGNINSPKISFKSDLDEMVAKRFRNLVKEKVQKVNKELNKELEKYKNQYESKLNRYKTDFEKYRTVVENYEGTYEKVLKEIKNKFSKKVLEKNIKKRILEKFKF